jgi:YegS/Rv2252/BmrU family lipid kinase
LITRFCEERSWDCDIHETSPEDDLRSVVSQALEKGVQLVIAAGGDGTVSGVVSAMVNSGVPMGIIPAGTGNALARDLSIPLDLEDSLELLRGPNQVQSLDIMEVNNNDYYVLNVSTGLSSIIMRRTAREEKRRFGMLAYLWRGVGSVLRSDLHRFRVNVDGRDYRFSASEVMVTNSRLLGLQPQLNGVSVDATDGRLDLFVVRARSAQDYLGVLAGFVLPREQNGDNNLRYLEVHQSVRIESEFPLPVQADGEEIGVTPFELRLIPRALQVVTPARRA